MPRFSLVVMCCLLALTALVPSFAVSSPVQAEQGCYIDGGSYSSSTTIIGYGFYDCGEDIAPSNRQLQVCIQRQNYGNVVCRKDTGLSYNYYRFSVSDLCSWGADYSQYRAYVWFYGEDKTVQQYYSPYWRSYLRCT